MNKTRHTYHSISSTSHLPLSLSSLFLIVAENKAIGVMRPGHTFTIEPMISEGTWRDVTWPDDWTSTTYVSCKTSFILDPLYQLVILHVYVDGGVKCLNLLLFQQLYVC